MKHHKNNVKKHVSEEFEIIIQKKNCNWKEAEPSKANMSSRGEKMK
jgi:hypothetical protein